MIKNEAAERIAELVVMAMNNAGVSQHGLSKLTGIPNTTLGRKLQARRAEFTISELSDVADALNVPVSTFLPPQFITPNLPNNPTQSDDLARIPATEVA